MAASARGLTALQPWRACAPVAITAGDNAAAPIKGILVDTDGDYGLVFELGSGVVTLPLKAGVVYPFVIRRLSAAAGNVFGGGA